MMVKLVAAGIASAVMSSANAECPSPSAGNGTVRPLVASKKEDVDLMLSMSMMPKMLEITYSREEAGKVPCSLGTFNTGSATYELRAAPDGLSNARIAFPKEKGAPIAELVPVTKILAAIEASKQGKAAPLSGYMLITLTKSFTTGWRLYDGIPNQQTLVTDMTAALTGRLRPVFRNDANGKGSIFVTE